DNSRRRFPPERDRYHLPVAHGAISDCTYGRGAAMTAFASPAPRRMLRARSGFTLVEVLAALVLMGIVLPVVMSAISASLSAAGTAKRSVEAASLAENKMGEIIALATYNTGTASGDFGAGWPEYRWASEMTDVDTDVMQITIRVSWPSRGSE